MNKKYDVIWSNIAEDDLLNIIEHIADDSTSNAIKVFKKIKEKASNLYFSPERGRIVPELQNHGILQYREIIIPPWRLLYRISKKNVYVLSVLDSHRNIEDILLNRFIKYKVYER